MFPSNTDSIVWTACSACWTEIGGADADYDDDDDDGDAVDDDDDDDGDADDDDDDADKLSDVAHSVPSTDEEILVSC